MRHIFIYVPSEFDNSFCIYVSIDLENVRTKSFLVGKSLNYAWK